MRARRLRVGVMKPADTLGSEDAQALALAVGSVLPTDLICPYHNSSAAPNLSHISRCFNEIAAQNDVVLVESTELLDFADLAAMLNLEVIVVVGNRPRCAEATKLVLDRCDNRGLSVAGYILCDCDRTTAVDDESPQQIVKARYLGRMRHREPLARSIVEKLV